MPKIKKKKNVSKVYVLLVVYSIKLVLVKQTRINTRHLSCSLSFSLTHSLADSHQLIHTGSPPSSIYVRGYKRSSLVGSSRNFSLFAQIHADRRHGHVGHFARTAVFPPVERHGSPRTRALSGHTGEIFTPAHLSLTHRHNH